jgi:hypothetical protein
MVAITNTFISEYNICNIVKIGSWLNTAYYRLDENTDDGGQRIWAK